MQTVRWEFYPLVAHNARFDFSFMNHELGLTGRLNIPESRMVDTLALARVRHLL